jgi:hypothetical protein
MMAQRVSPKTRALVLFALLIAILGTLVFLPGPTPRETPANLPKVSVLPESVSELIEESETVSATPREPLSSESQRIASVQPAAETDAVPESCIEASNAGFQFAEGIQLDEGLCRAAAGLVAGPLVPALPGLPGYDVPDTGDPFRKRLIDEPDDPEWSRLMESRIYSEIGVMVDYPVVALQASCKTSTCGVLIAYSNGVHHGGNYNEFAQHLADTLGFNGYHGGHAIRPEFSMGFTYIYLGDWVTERPDANTPPRTFPATFEEIKDSLTSDPDESSP